MFPAQPANGQSVALGHLGVEDVPDMHKAQLAIAKTARLLAACPVAQKRVPTSMCFSPCMAGSINSIELLVRQLNHYTRHCSTKTGKQLNLSCCVRCTIKDATTSHTSFKYRLAPLQAQESKKRKHTTSTTCTHNIHNAILSLLTSMLKDISSAGVHVGK